MSCGSPPALAWLNSEALGGCDEVVTVDRRFSGFSLTSGLFGRGEDGRLRDFVTALEANAHCIL